MNKKVSLSFALSMAALVAALTFILTMAASTRIFNQKISEVDRLAEKYQRLEQLDAEVRQYYYTDIDENEIMNGILKGYVNGLGDPYSEYLTAEELSADHIENAGQYVGVGITVSPTENQEVEIIEVFEGGGAHDAGIVAGDIILQVDALPVSEDYDGALDAIVGEEGTYVKLTLRRADQTEYTVSVERRKVDEPTIYYEMLENNMGYIRIKKFRTVSVEQFRNALNSLRADGAKGFIFDVRNNGGGMLDALEKILDPLLPEGEIAFAYDKDGNASPILKSDSEQLQMPFVVLTNPYTASAAELFACSLRDYADAILVGEKTFGKGIMQSTFSLSDGGGLTITTATYATGKTECYHGIGITPDVLSIYDAQSDTDSQLEDAKSTLRNAMEKAAA
ncbi:MAG: S41 family peptidase [Oscillospiraceae bacterium]|nr:S41 family peptidase [Oscillospiraceae bacterium]